MKGRNPKNGYCGYAEHLKIESEMPYGETLMKVSPESEAGMTEYEVEAAVAVMLNLAVLKVNGMYMQQLYYRYKYTRVHNNGCITACYRQNFNKLKRKKTVEIIRGD